MEEEKSREDALRSAHREFGDLAIVEENSREVWQGPIESIVVDIGYALRKFGRFAHIAIPIVLTMALSIGACTAIFTLLYAILLSNGIVQQISDAKRDRVYCAQVPLHILEDPAVCR